MAIVAGVVIGQLLLIREWPKAGMRVALLLFVGGYYLGPYSGDYSNYASIPASSVLLVFFDRYRRLPCADHDPDLCKGLLFRRWQESCLPSETLNVRRWHSRLQGSLSGMNSTESATSRRHSPSAADRAEGTRLPRHMQSVSALADAFALSYGALVALFLVLFAASIHFLTVEPDEAWMLLSTGQVAGGPFAGVGIVSNPVITSGGLYTLIHYPLLRMGLPVEAQRVVSLVFSVLTLGMVYALAKAQWGSARGGLAATAAFLTVPGFLLQAGLATAEMMSTFLLIAAAWHWSARGSRSLAGSAVSGILFGLASATRLSALIPLPAVVIWSLLYARVVPRVILHAVVASATASAIFLVSGGIYYALFNTHNDLHTLASNMASATGVARPTDVASIISSFATSETLFPASMMVVAAVALIPSPQRESFAAIRPLCVMLWLIGAIGWAAWIVKAPIPHVRYLWPALPAAWLCGVLLLVDWLMALKPGRGRVLLHTAILSVGATQFALSFRQVAYGDSLKLVYEAARWSPIAGFQPFHARQDQDRVASIVAGLPAEAQVYALVPPVSYPITWLTGREIRPLSEFSASPPSGRGDQYLVLFPSDKSIWRPTLETLNWIEANATLHSRFDDYSVYRIKADAAPYGPTHLEN